MKKIIIAIVVLVAGGLGVGPYFVGSQVETLINKNMEQTNQMLEKQLQNNVFKVNYRIISYNKGYLDSTFDSEVVVSIPDEKNLVIPFKNEVKHGPLLMGKKTLGTAIVNSHLDTAKLSLPEGEKPDFITDDFLTSVSYIDFTGNHDTAIKVKPFAFSESGDSIDFKGVTSNFKGSLKDISSYAIDMTFNGLIVGSNGQVNIEPFTASGSRAKDGKINFKFGNIAINADTREGNIVSTLDSLTINGTQIWSDTLSTYIGRVDTTLNNMVIDAKNENINIAIDNIDLFYDIEEMPSNNFKFAYGFNIKPNKDSIKAFMIQSPVQITPESLDFSFEIEKLPNSLIAFYTNMLKQVQENPNAFDDGTLEQQFQSAMLDFANNGVSAKKNLVLKTEEGSLSINADVRMLEGLNLTVDDINQLAMSQSPTAVLKLFEGTTSISLDEPLATATGADMFISMYGGAGLVEQNPQTNAYEAKIETKDGVLTINNQPIPLP